MRIHATHSAPTEPDYLIVLDVANLTVAVRGKRLLAGAAAVSFGVAPPELH